MRSRQTKWLSGVAAVVLALSVGVVMAAPPPSNPGQPFQEILNKLDQVLDAIKNIPNSGGGGGGQDGNHTLRWDTNNPSDSRFVTAFPGAVLDKNTGLVWEQAPETTGGPNGDGTYTWGQATDYCVNKNVGGTVGWRLPSVMELKSVQDPTLVAPFVPANAFTGVLQVLYWSASSNGGFSFVAWYVDFSAGSVANGSKDSDLMHAWCVRGPMQASAY